MRHMVVKLSAVSALEFSQFISAKVAFILRQIAPFDFLTHVFRQFNQKIGTDLQAVEEELQSVQQQLRGFVRSLVTLTDCSDESLTWALLLCKNLREQNNFQLLKTALNALTEDCCQDVYRHYQGQLAQIPELVAHDVQVPQNSVRAELEKLRYHPATDRRVVDPKLKTIIADCYKSCGVLGIE